MILKAITPEKYSFPKKYKVHLNRNKLGLYIISDVNEIDIGIASQILSGEKKELIELGSHFTGTISKCKKNHFIVKVKKGRKRKVNSHE